MREERHSKVDMRRFAPALPGLFTFGNLVCGFFALLHAMGDRPYDAAWFIFLGAFLDALDGKVARKVKATSSIGIQLDSLADFITFGVAPVALMRAVGLFDLGDWKLAVGILYLFAGAYRLARFNVSAKLEGVTYYEGLPIPIAAVTVSSGILFINKVWPPIHGTGALGGVAVLAWLMVSNIKYNKYLPKIALSHNAKWLLVVPSLLLIFTLILFPVYCIYPLMVIYIMFGLVREIIHWITHRPKEKENDYGEIPSEGYSSEN